MATMTGYNYDVGAEGKNDNAAWGCGLVLVLTVIAVIALMAVYMSSQASVPHRSSTGVTAVAHNTVKLADGQKLVIANGWGQRWSVDYHAAGGDVKVAFSDGGGGKHLHMKPGQIEKVDMGLLRGDLIIVLNTDGTLGVQWPDGWHLAK